MPESQESSLSFPSSSPHKGEQLQKWLPALLSLIAGLVDVIGYVSLKLFTAHVTGNIVIIAAQLVYGGPPKMDQILAVPVFILAVAGVWISAQALHRRGPTLSRLLLLIQFLLLVCVLVVAVIYHPDSDPSGLMADVTAMIAIAAMASQYSFLQLAMPGAPSTAVMTGNLTKTVLAFLETATELTATLILVPTGVQTLATSFWAQQSSLNYAAAAPYAGLMVLIAAVPSYVLARYFDRRPAGAKRPL